MPLKDWLKNQNLHLPTPPPRQDTFPLSHSLLVTRGLWCKRSWNSRSAPFLPRWLPLPQPSSVALCRSLWANASEGGGGGVTGRSQLMSMDSEVGREAESFWMLSNSDAISGLALI